ncbi:unnamed protein product [Rotaria sp. Silwood2]|nr:unnamed protein product [Rotaria sp. Silwood2]
MSNSDSSKLLTSENVINYYSDGTSVEGMNIAELARTFDTQVKISSLENQSTQISPHDQHLKLYVDYQHGNHQEHDRNATRLQNMEISFSTTQKISNNRSSTARVNDRAIHEKPSAIDSHNCSPMIQLTTRQIPHSHNHGQHSLANYQISSSHDSLKYEILPQKQTSDKAKYTVQRVPDESDTFNHNIARELNVRQKSQAHNIAHQTVNYFQPMQYPLEKSLKKSSEGFSPQQISIITDTGSSDMELTNIQHLLNLIEQDNLHTAQPYVSSRKFKKNCEDDQLLVDTGSKTAATVQKDYTRQSENTYHRQVPARRYSDTNGFRLYKKMHSQNSFTSDQHSSVNRRQHRVRHRVQASPSINVSQPSNTVDTQSQTDSE